MQARETSPAAERQGWVSETSVVQPQMLERLLESPGNQLEVFNGPEWGPSNAWVSIPDIGGPWSQARIECAAEKLGPVSQDPCDYFINLVVRRGPDGLGSVVAARAEFQDDALDGDPNARYHDDDDSLVSRRCRGFAQCLVSRGFSQVDPMPLAPGEQGELIAFQVVGRELPRTGREEDARKWLDQAIEGTQSQLQALDADPDFSDPGWVNNRALVQRLLEYYEWLRARA